MNEHVGQVIVAASGEARAALDRKVDVLFDRVKDSAPTQPLSLEWFGWVVRWKGGNFAAGTLFGRREMSLTEFLRWEEEYNGFVDRFAAMGLDMTNVKRADETAASPGPGGGPSGGGSWLMLALALLWLSRSRSG
jgi:hypothetical protein